MEFSDLKPGKVMGRAVKWGSGEDTSKGDGKLVIRFEMKVPVPPELLPVDAAAPTADAAAPAAPVYEIVSTEKAFYSHTEGVMKITLKALAAMGWHLPSTQEEASVAYDALTKGGGNLGEREVELVLDYNNYTSDSGRTTSTLEIAFVQRPGGGGLEIIELPPEKQAKAVSNFVAMAFKMKARESVKGNVSAAPAIPGGNSTPAPAPVSNDDIPF